jgi:hypothetical protein
VSRSEMEWGGGRAGPVIRCCAPGGGLGGLPRTVLGVLVGHHPRLGCDACTRSDDNFLLTFQNMASSDCAKI